jgi:opacity protein-like surface antigen
MQKLLAIFSLFIVFGLPAMAQDIPVQEAPKPEATKPSAKKKKPQMPTPKFEFDAGYTYRSYSPPLASRFGMNGWNGDIVYNYNRWLGVVGDFTGTYKDQGFTGKSSIYTFMAGPRVYMFGHRHRLIPYGQFLFGAGHEIVNLPLNGGFAATTRTSNGYAYAGGAGIEYRFAKHWTARVFEFDYEKTHFSDLLFLAGNPLESNCRNRLPLGRKARTKEMIPRFPSRRKD